jgi:undecaprenyl diphosphate synthase
MHKGVLKPTITPVVQQLPRHIAIIMDGNGRWAKRQFLPRIAGHRAGLEVVRKITKICAEKGIEVLTLFAFSTENWQRPKQEVNALLELFFNALDREVKKLHENNVQLHVIGSEARFSAELKQRINAAQQLTANNTGLKLVIAFDYSGQWDITQATNQLATKVAQGLLKPGEITPKLIEQHLSTTGLPEPDLFIRTSGEQRISNFLLWQLAYTELYFTDAHWPDFSAEILEDALEYFASRERRFGCTSEQINEQVA